MTETVAGKFGSVANFNVKTIEGYMFSEQNSNNVTSGILSGNGTVTLKGYYIPAITETIEGLRNAATLNLGIGEVLDYTLTQYVITTTNATKGDLGAAATIGSVTYTGVDVTEAYPDLIVNGVANTSILDGIFKLEAIGANGAATYKFEQYVDGVFTWNNIVESAASAADTASVKLIGAYAWQNSWKPYDTASVDVVTIENDEMLATKLANCSNAPADTSGLYWKTVMNPSGTSTGNSDGTGVRIMPVHTWTYYNDLWLGATVTYNALFTDPGRGNNTAYYAFLSTGGYATNNSAKYNMWPDTSSGNKWRVGSFTLDENHFVALSATNYSYGSKIRAGSLVSNFRNSTIYDKVVIYVGNITATMPEATE